LMRMGRKARLRTDEVIIPHAQLAPAHTRRVIIAGEGEMVPGDEPSMVSAANAVEIANVDHGPCSCAFPKEGNPASPRGREGKAAGRARSFDTRLQFH